MIGAVIQARMGSTRLPGKVMMDLGGKPSLVRVIERAKRIKGVDRVILATTTKPEDEVLIQTAQSCKIAVFAGSENDVLGRYYKTAEYFHLDAIARITADCPLLDPAVSSKVVRAFVEGGYDYVSNCHPPTYPDGLDTEVFSFQALRKAWVRAISPFEREHVTPFIWRRPYKFKALNIVHYGESLVDHRWTLDTEDDYRWIKTVYETLGENAATASILSSGLERLQKRALL
jgi:spore coat polysaccharide biosynthesis protein SpsF (cytidylyltransferase family)